MVREFPFQPVCYGHAVSSLEVERLIHDLHIKTYARGELWYKSLPTLLVLIAMNRKG
jgi:hypothetical protein